MLNMDREYRYESIAEIEEYVRKINEQHKQGNGPGTSVDNILKQNLWHKEYQTAFASICNQLEAFRKKYHVFYLELIYNEDEGWVIRKSYERGKSVAKQLNLR